MSDKRVLVDWLLKVFESKYKNEWRKERFSVLGDEDCGYSHADLDFIFFWKIYDQGWFAGQSGVIFDKLRRLAGGGPRMIESMAAISPDHAEHLKDAVEKKVLSPEILQEPFAQVRGGWQVLGCAVKAAKQLHGLYPAEETSYIARWLAKFICNKQWTGSWEELVDYINYEIGQAIRDFRRNYPMLPSVTRKFLDEKLLAPSEVHLFGSGPETLSYFFRDWKDVILWKYMWKHDEKNRKFWRLVSQVLGPSDMGPQESDHHTVLNFLGSVLTSNEIENGAMAKINTTVFRLFRDLREEGIKAPLEGMV